MHLICSSALKGGSKIYYQDQKVCDASSSPLNHCILCIFHAFLSSADFFQNLLFEKNLSGIPSECQTVWTQIRPDDSDESGSKLFAKVISRYTGRQRVCLDNVLCLISDNDIFGYMYFIIY